MTASNELEGVELAVAVAERLEYKIGEYEIVKGTMQSLPFPRMMMWRDDHYERYRPDRNIAQAWELDGEGWQWESIEFHSGFRNGHTTGLLMEVRHLFKPGRIARTSVEFADFPTKAQAYATARCRAYLEGMGK